jgi:hypothetical protein
MRHKPWFYVMRLAPPIAPLRRKIIAPRHVSVFAHAFLAEVALAIALNAPNERGDAAYWVEAVSKPAHRRRRPHGTRERRRPTGPAGANTAAIIAAVEALVAADT